MTAPAFSRGTWAGLAVLGAAVIVTMLFSWQIRSRAEQVADALAAAPLVAIADFPAQGHARVEGPVQLVGPSLLAPLSGRPCAFYEIELDGLPGWAGPRRKAVGRDFLLADASGTALVRLERAMVAPGSAMIGAMVAIDAGHCQTGTLAEIAADRRNAALRLVGERAPGEGELGEIRYRECVLAEGAPVAVAGTSEERRAPVPGRPGSGRVTLAASPRFPLYIATRHE